MRHLYYALAAVCTGVALVGAVLFGLGIYGLLKGAFILDLHVAFIGAMRAIVGFLVMGAFVEGSRALLTEADDA